MTKNSAQKFTRIGVFDSGVGGLSVLKSLLDSRLFSEIIYFGDTARVPYGNKDKRTILRFSMEALDFFAPFNLDMLVVGCNTVSAYALNAMQKRANFPIVGVIESGVMSVNRKIADKNSHILIIGTKATINSGIYANRLQKCGFQNLTSLQTGLFVPLVEEGIFGGEVLEASFKYYFGQNLAPDAVILGCTHFPLIQNEIKKYFQNKPILIHSGEAIVEFLCEKYHLKAQNAPRTKVKFFASGDANALKQVARIWLGN